MGIVLKNQNGEIIDLSNHGERKILFFYPRANTPGCTLETREYGEFYKEFKELGVEVFGISKDTVKKQSNFSNKLETPFSLLSDVDGIICEKFGVWQEKKFMGKTSMGIVRSTFLLDKNNNIIKEWRKVKVKGHVEEVLEFCKG